MVACVHGAVWVLDKVLVNLVHARERLVRSLHGFLGPLVAGVGLGLLLSLDLFEFDLGIVPFGLRERAAGDNKRERDGGGHAEQGADRKCHAKTPE